MMKKIDWRKILLFILTITIICTLKNLFIDSSDIEDYSHFAKNILISFGEKQLLNIIWLIPIMLNIYVIARKYFFKLQQFETRYNNRKHFINKLLLKCNLDSIIYNFLISVLQIIILSLATKNSIIINMDIVTVVVQYIIEMTFLNIIFVLCAMYIKNFMYTYIIFLIFIIVSLTAVINLSLIGMNPYLPYMNMYFSDRINVVTILLTIIFVFIIKKIYICYDILGGIDQ